MAHYKEAAEQYRQILENNRRQLGPSHIYVAFALSSLSNALIEDGRSEEAIPLMDEALDIFQENVGQEHRYYARSLAIKGKAIFHENPSQALSIFDRSKNILIATVGPDHPDLGRILTNLGRAQSVIDEFEAAETTFREALKIQRKELTVQHANTIWTLVNFGQLLTEQGRVKEAEPLLREAVEASADVLPPEH